MNWGYKILITIVLFLVGMLSMVYLSMQQSNEMIDENYYTLEKDYQRLIDGQNALKSVQSESLLSQNDSVIIVKLPATTYLHIQDADIKFLKPDNQKLDISFQISPNDSGFYFIPKSQLTKGVYKVRTQWTNDSQFYYSDEKLFVE
ncbi:MAG: FixH family protein [Chitinophagales bacterium]|nr:FixH family protein [Chitinophagales bacterium]